jgi:uncharacterized membrane protein YpjA
MNVSPFLIPMSLLITGIYFALSLITRQVKFRNPTLKILHEVVFIKWGGWAFVTGLIIGFSSYLGAL